MSSAEIQSMFVLAHMRRTESSENKTPNKNIFLIIGQIHS